MDVVKFSETLFAIGRLKASNNCQLLQFSSVKDKRKINIVNNIYLSYNHNGCAKAPVNIIRRG